MKKLLKKFVRSVPYYSSMKSGLNCKVQQIGRLIKAFVEKLPFLPVVRGWIKSRRQQRELAQWQKHGCPAPPPHIVKQQTIREFAKKFELNILVETGTYYGDMVEAMRPHFMQIYSIELSNELYEKAKNKFAGDERIKIINGDSGIVLGNLLQELKQPALFWLDGHYSVGITARGEKDTPILEELGHILRSQHCGCVVIIDDARVFGTDPAYPTLEEVVGLVRSRQTNMTIKVESDSIRIFPVSVGR